MTTHATTEEAADDEDVVEHLDVLVVGAGISGIGAAYHLRTSLPGKSFLVLDASDHHGGTWWTHRYPGARSDTDLYTYGYSFKPWVGPAIATSDEILHYLDEVIAENDLGRYLRYRHRVLSATWSTDSRRWTVEVAQGDTGESVRFTADFLWMCQGYYDHQRPYAPTWPGMERFSGHVVHPQNWPEDLDYRGKRVVVIGSGATAATLVPAIASTAGHVTMLQRSPTFFFARPRVHELAERLRALDIPPEWSHEILRRAHRADSAEITRMSFEAPEQLREDLLNAARELLPEGFDVDKHFNPKYRPWQQRLAVVPDGDLFAAIGEGRASVATDEIASFTETGILLASGEVLEADIVVTATGFTMSLLDGIELVVDGRRTEVADEVTYRGMMLTGLPNLVHVFGYFRAAWTLRVDLISGFVCRLLDEMEARGATMVVPVLRTEDRDMPLGPWVDPDNFNPGYLTRALDRLPKQGDRDPWRLLTDYEVEKTVLPEADLDDGTLEFK